MKIENNLLSDPKADVTQRSPNHGGAISPTAIILHYTASGGEDGKGDADYLSRASSRASAHVVVGRNGSIDQIVPFNTRAWHAGVSKLDGKNNVNDFSIGIEIDNWGWLTNGKSHAGVPVKNVFKGNRSGKSEWEAYTEAQLDAVEEVIAAIVAEYPITRIVGHEDIAPGRKQDPGPALDAFKAKMQEKYLGKKQVAKPKESLKAGTKKTTVDGLRLRQQASRSAVILTSMARGTVVEELKRDIYPGWSQVKVGARIGYVANRYLG